MLAQVQQRKVRQSQANSGFGLRSFHTHASPTHGSKGPRVKGVQWLNGPISAKPASATLVAYLLKRVRLYGTSLLAADDVSEHRLVHRSS